MVGYIVGVGPGESVGVTGDLAVRAVPQRVVYVETVLLRQVHPTRGDERQTALGERFSRVGEGEAGQNYPRFTMRVVAVKRLRAPAWYLRPRRRSRGLRGVPFSPLRPLAQRRGG